MNVENATSTDDLLEKWGEYGVEVPPRPKRSKEQKEAWLVRRLFKYLASKNLLKFPLSITHSDAPDFTVTEHGCTWLLEVTEATVPVDQREMSVALTGAQPIGHSGGRGNGGYGGDAPENEVIADINNAIQRKATKPYASPQCSLLLYVNSNPGVVANQSCVRTRLSTEIISNPFAKVFVIWGEKVWEP